MPRPVPKDFFPPPFSGLQLFASAADDDEEDDDKLIIMMCTANIIVPRFRNEGGLLLLCLRGLFGLAGGRRE